MTTRTSFRKLDTSSNTQGLTSEQTFSASQTENLSYTVTASGTDTLTTFAVTGFTVNALGTMSLGNSFTIASLDGPSAGDISDADTVSIQGSGPASGRRLNAAATGRSDRSLHAENR